LNERLKDEARYRLQGDGLHDAGAAADDDGVRSNLQQQLTFAIHVSSLAVLFFFVCFIFSSIISAESNAVDTLWHCS